MKDYEIGKFIRNTEIPKRRVDILKEIKVGEYKITDIPYNKKERRKIYGLAQRVRSVKNSKYPNYRMEILNTDMHKVEINTIIIHRLQQI